MTFSVGHVSDSGEEFVSNGHVFLRSSDLELMRDQEKMELKQNDGQMLDGNPMQVVGITFANVNIPSGSVIISARVLFSIDEVQSSSASDVAIRIHGEASANAAQMSNADFDLSSRPLTSANVSWSPAPSVFIGEELRTSDVASIINEIISLPGWAVGNTICILFRHADGDGDRWVESYGVSNTGVATPALEVEVLATPPRPPLPPQQPPSPSNPARCIDGCYYSFDGSCDDGGAGSEYHFCGFGSDCTDCGVRVAAPASPPAPPAAPGFNQGAIQVRTTRELWAAIHSIPPSGSADIYLCRGSTFLLEGIPIALRDQVNVHLWSDGEGATIDSEGRMSMFHVAPGVQLKLTSLTLMRGYGTVASGTLDIVNASVAMVDTKIVDSLSSGSIGGSAISLQLGTVAITKGSMISNCTDLFGYGGAIGLESAALTIDNSSIVACTCRGSMGGALFTFHSVVTVINSSIANCTAVIGGVMGVQGGSLVVADCIISYSTAKRHAGVMNCIASTVEFSNTLFIESTALLGAGLMKVGDHSSVLMIDCSIINSLSIGGMPTVGEEDSRSGGSSGGAFL
eukprot:4774681-Prymnesium_polylepis.1